MPVPTTSFIYNQAGYEIFARSATPTLDLETVAKLKIMLVNSLYSAANDDAHKDIELVDAGGGSDILTGEINATGYTGTYGGAGRLDLTVSPSFGVGPNDTANRVEFDSNDVDWGTLGGVADDTIIGAVIIVEDQVGVAGNDTESRPVMFIDLADTTTNGSGFQIQWSSAGIAHWTH
jgi:hypothetical protein